jgi:capsule polysaccharide export protein KpsE/RkpR
MRTAIIMSMTSAILLLGCGEQTKIKECNDFIAVINRGVEKVQKGTSGTPDGGAAVAELRALADEMDVISKEAAAIAVSLPDLKKLAADYQAMVTEVAAAARDLASAVDSVDMEKMTAAQTRMDNAVKREDPLIEQLNKFCQAP